MTSVPYPIDVAGDLVAGSLSGRERGARAGKARPSARAGTGDWGDFGFIVRAATVGDVVIMDVRNHAFARAESPCALGGLALMYLVRRGAWRLAWPGGRGLAVTSAAGSFAACPGGPPPLLEADPGTAVTVLILPTAALGPPALGRAVVGSARSAEARVLLAHADAAGEAAEGLSPVGARGARDALLQLVRAGPGPGTGAGGDGGGGRPTGRP
jgi:AraC family transcriptional regulator, positive regulator of tynA and feaB